MTNSENKAREYLKKKFRGCYIRKFPDFKQTGFSLLRGLPDYFIIWLGATIWYEVKYIQGFRFNFKELSEFQYIEFRKFLEVGHDITILVVCKSDLHYFYREIPFSKILKLSRTQKSIELNKNI